MPCHNSIAISSTCLPVSLILCWLEFNSFGSWQAVVVIHGSKTIGSSILKVSLILVSIVIVDLCETIESAICKCTCLYLCLVEVINRGCVLAVLACIISLLTGNLESIIVHNLLESVSFPIIIGHFVYDIVILVLSKLSMEARSINHIQLTVFASLVFIPFTLIDVAIFIVHGAHSIPCILLEVSRVELTIAEQYLYLTISNLPSLETALNEFIRITEKDSLSMWMAIPPLTLVNCTISKFAESCSVAEVIFEVTFEDVSVWHHILTLSMLESLGDCPIVH